MTNTSPACDPGSFFLAAEEGAVLKSRMMELGYSVAGFARALGVPRTTLYDIFQGKYAMTREFIEKLNAIDPDRNLLPAWKIEKKASLKVSASAPAKKARAKRTSSQNSTD